MKSTVMQGIMYAVLGFALFSAQDALIKSFNGELSVFQIIFFGMIFSLLPLTYFIAFNPQPVIVRSNSPVLMFARTLSAIIAMPCAVYAFSVLPLQHVYAIIFAAPIFITLLAIPFLGEKVQMYRAVALLVGFIGIMIILRPNVATLSLGHLAAFISALLIAVGAILNRKLGGVENKVSMVIYPLIGNIMFCSLFLFWVYEPMSGAELFKLISIGLLAVVAQTCIVIAYAKAPAAAVAPFQYTQMFWAIIFGYFFFGEGTTKFTWIGTSLIIASGLFILYREARKEGSMKPLTNTQQFRGAAVSLPMKQQIKEPPKDPFEAETLATDEDFSSPENEDNHSDQDGAKGEPVAAPN